MVGLNQDSIQISIGQTDTKINLLGVGEVPVGPVFVPCFLNEVVASIGSGHFVCSAQELAVEVERPCSSGRRRGRRSSLRRSEK